MDIKNLITDQNFITAVTSIIGTLATVFGVKALISKTVRKATENTPEEYKKIFIEILDAVKQGLIDADYEGDKNLVSNDKVEEIFKKIDLDKME